METATTCDNLVSIFKMSINQLCDPFHDNCNFFYKILFTAQNYLNSQYYDFIKSRLVELQNMF